MVMSYDEVHKKCNAVVVCGMGGVVALVVGRCLGGREG